MPEHGTRTEPGGSDESKSALVLGIIQGKTIVAEASPSTTCRPRKSSSTNVISKTFKKRTARRCWSHAREKLQSLLDEDEK